MEDYLGAPGAAGMGWDIAAACRLVDNVKSRYVRKCCYLSNHKILGWGVFDRCVVKGVS